MNSSRLIPIFVAWLTVIALDAIAAPSAMPTVAPWTLESVNASGSTALVTDRSEGSAVLRAQILLDRARFSPGEIDAAYGSSMQHAVAGFQASNGIAATGIVDAATWAALDRDSAPALVLYELGAEDVAGPFTKIPADMMAKSKLPALGYASAIEALGEKFHANPMLLRRLNPGKNFTRSGESVVVPSVEATVPMPVVARLVVDRSASTVTLFDAAGKVVAQYPASTGSEHDPLPIGAWKILGVARHPVFRYNPALFWDSGPSQSKATIPAGPNNPVGVVWIDLSKEHYGIHGTPEPSKVGKTESHGCIRMTNWSAATTADAVRPGMPAILQE